MSDQLYRLLGDALVAGGEDIPMWREGLMQLPFEERDRLIAELEQRGVQGWVRMAFEAGWGDRLSARTFAELVAYPTGYLLSIYQSEFDLSMLRGVALDRRASPHVRVAAAWITEQRCKANNELDPHSADDQEIVRLAGQVADLDQDPDSSADIGIAGGWQLRVRAQPKCA